MWDYTTDFGNFIMPYPNLRVVGDNVRLFVNSGVKGSRAGRLAVLRWRDDEWLAPGCWPSSVGPKRRRRLLEEFSSATTARGPDDPWYLRLAHESVEQTKAKLVVWGSPSAAYLTLDLMARAEELFREAEATVRDDAALLNRVQVARLPIRYVWAKRWHDLHAAARKRLLPWPGPADEVSNMQTFMEVCRANDITMVAEGVRADSLWHRIVDFGRIPSPVPPGCEALAVWDIIDLQDHNLSLALEGTLTSLEHDDLASDKVAARMPGTHCEWAVQQPQAPSASTGSRLLGLREYPRETTGQAGQAHRRPP